MVPKFPYVRSRKLLQAVASLPCQHCGRHGMTQAAHSNQQCHGKGRGIKASDQYTAALCERCHHTLDQGAELSKEARREMWTVAHRRTVRELLCRELWPVGVPIPEPLETA